MPRPPNSQFLVALTSERRDFRRLPRLFCQLAALSRDNNKPRCQGFGQSLLMEQASGSVQFQTRLRFQSEILKSLRDFASQPSLPCVSAMHRPAAGLPRMLWNRLRRKRTLVLGERGRGGTAPSSAPWSCSGPLSRVFSRLQGFVSSKITASLPSGFADKFADRTA